jgi:hypothetical protein
VALPCVAVACVFAGKLRYWIILVNYLFIALAKTMTPQWECPGGAGASLASDHISPSDYKIVPLSQKAIAYTDLLGAGC